MSSLIPYGRNKSRELNPFQIMRSFFEDPFFTDFGVAPYSAWGGIRADVKDMGQEFVVEAELPGVNKDRISVDIHDGVLTISANEQIEQKEEKDDYIYRERRVGHMSRSFSLENVNEAGIKAAYKDGVLFVHLPKQEPAKLSARKVEIN